MLNSNELTDKVVVITGAGGEIGTATARLFSERGAKVVAVDSSEEALARLANAIPKDRTHTVVADVTDEQKVAHYVSEALHRFGQIDVFFNNAGVEGPVHPISEYPLDAFRTVIDVNLIGVFLGLKHVAPVMQKAKRGSIINTSSVAGLTGTAGICAYNATKHAVIGLTRSAAAELGPQGIRVNSVNPGPLSSRMMESLETGLSGGDPGSVSEALSAMIPLGRYGTPEEVATLVAYLGSDDARYINGSVMTVDGGFTVG
ncbi:SDR family oxidoreductase [Thioclava sp. BHET1]|nr:SDR family oxidoreductase [Thioclava sp. BHET1]